MNPSIPLFTDFWHGTVREFLSFTQDTFLQQMCAQFSGYRKTYHVREQVPSSAQERAWRDCFTVLQQVLAAERDDAFQLVFEFCLPREGGRRPDVLLIGHHHVVVLEFKQKDLPAKQSDLDQAARYGYDLSSFHAVAQKQIVQTFLVLTKTQAPCDVFDHDRKVRVISSDQLDAAIALVKQDDAPDIDAWLEAPYEPIPSILTAAFQVMKGASLPEIRKAKSYGLPETLTHLEEVVALAKERRAHVVAFVTGVPGAGKTYLGLQLVYHSAEMYPKDHAIYVSGNEPLVKVLRHQLGKESEAMIAQIHHFLTDDSYKRSRAHVIVFDEGQRAWASRSGSASEPEAMLSYLDHLHWGVLVILIGTGQEIYTRETITPNDWKNAIEKNDKRKICWSILRPEDSAFCDVFQGFHGKATKALNLTKSLRTPQDEKIPQIIEHILDGAWEIAKDGIAEILETYPMYITRDPTWAKVYCQERYAAEPEKRYGWLRSSQANGKSQGRRNEDQYIPWFTAPPKDEASCCAMNILHGKPANAATEFECQGLEVDFAAIEWGRDFLYEHGTWQIHAENLTKEHRRYRKNAYRVLLTRGREGFLLYFPKDPVFDATYHQMKTLGLKELEKPSYDVVAAVIVHNGKIFSAQRGYGEFQGKWEFPGGKIEPGETPEQALVREIREELGATILVERFLDTVTYDYPTFHLIMECYLCTLATDAIELREHKGAKWLSPQALNTVDWLPADQKILAKVKAIVQ